MKKAKEFPTCISHEEAVIEELRRAPGFAAHYPAAAQEVPDNAYCVEIALRRIAAANSKPSDRPIKRPSSGNRLRVSVPKGKLGRGMGGNR